MNKRLRIQWVTAFVCLVSAFFVPHAGATTICRWVDENGRTQLSEKAPDPYKQVAICIDSQKYELSPPQRRAGDGSGSSGQPVTQRPNAVIIDTTDCVARWRVYDESAECIGPYRTARGSTQPDAFDRCKVVVSPALQCGPRRN